MEWQILDGKFNIYALFTIMLWSFLKKVCYMKTK